MIRVRSISGSPNGMPEGRPYVYRGKIRTLPVTSWDITCPTCLSAAGKPCTSQAGNEIGEHHLARKKAAR
jgi:hypothetical protein